MMAQCQGSDAKKLSMCSSGDVVEINLLLPAGRVEALLALSRERGQSVGQILRQWIDLALAADE